MDFLGVGAGPSPLGSAGGGSMVMLPSEVYETPLLDLTVPNLGVEVAPAKPGYMCVGINAHWLIEQAQGNQTVPITVQMGTDPTHTNNLQPTTFFPTAAQFNACVGNTPCWPIGAGFSNSTAFAIQHNANSPMIMDVTPGAGTGPLVFKARLVIQIQWMATG